MRRPRDADARTNAVTSIQMGVERVPGGAELATAIPVLVESVLSRVPVVVAGDPVVVPAVVAALVAALVAVVAIVVAAANWSRILTCRAKSAVA